MKKNQRLIAVSTRIINSQGYFEPRDALSHDWPKLLEKLGFYPIFVSNFLSDVKSFLENTKIDGIILSGGDNIGKFPSRDKTEIQLIKFGIKNNIPIFGVCRGMQVINNYFKGTLQKTTNKKHVKTSHLIKIDNKQFIKSLKKKSVTVNSFHNNIIKKEGLGKNLDSFAITKSDETIEGFFHEIYPIIGVMWHPERMPNNFSKQILKKFFDGKLF